MSENHFDLAYENYIRSTIAPVHGEVERVLGRWKTAEFWLQFREDGGSIPQPIQHVELRDKRLESILDKFKRQRSDFVGGRKNHENLRIMRDVLGARIIVYVPAQLRLIDQAIRNSDEFVLAPGFSPRCYLPEETFDRVGLERSDFAFRGPKRSGYASIHYFVQLAVPVADENPIFEIQTRTMLEQVWGQIEHQLGYKVGQDTEFSVARQFRVISSQLSALDDHFDFIYDRLTYLQQRSNPHAKDAVNAENLPRIMHDHQILLRQGEIDSLLTILGTNKVRTVGQLRGRLTPGILGIIRDEFAKSNPGETIGAFDVIPAIAVLKKMAKPDHVREAFIEAQKYGQLVRRLRVDIKREIRSLRSKDD